MSVTEQLQKVMSEKAAELSKDAELQALSAFYEAAKRDGIAKAPEYSLPQIDTIGRQFNQADDSIQASRRPESSRACMWPGRTRFLSGRVKASRNRA